MSKNNDGYDMYDMGYLDDLDVIEKLGLFVGLIDENIYEENKNTN